MWGTVYNRTARRRLDELLRSVRPDVAHLHNVFDQLTLSVVDSLDDAGVPIVMTAHDYRPVCPNYRLLAPDGVCRRCVDTGRYWHAVRLRCHQGSFTRSALVAVESRRSRSRGVYERIDRFVAPSRFLRDVLVDGGLPAARIDVVPNAVAVGCSTAARQVDAPPTFIYFGRYTAEKGLDDLLTATARLEHGARVELFGAGPLQDRLRERVAAEGLPAVVHPEATLAEILPVLRGSVAAVLPARWHENCPMAILEAAAEGVATIATSMGGIPELITNGENGLLVPPGSPGALARAMDELAAEPGRALELGHNARARLQRFHDPATHLAGLLDSYERAIERRAQR